MSKHIVAQYQVGFSPFATNSLAEFAVKKLPKYRCLWLLAASGNVAGWLYAENRDALLYKILQEIAVIACNFDDEAFRIHTKPSSDQFGISSGVIKPTIRIG